MTKTQPNHIKIRLAQPQDRNQLFDIQRDAIQTLCSTDYSPEQIQALLNDIQLDKSQGEAGLFHSPLVRQGINSLSHS